MRDSCPRPFKPVSLKADLSLDRPEEATAEPGNVQQLLLLYLINPMPNLSPAGALFTHFSSDACWGLLRDEVQYFWPRLVVLAQA